MGTIILSTRTRAGAIRELQGAEGEYVVTKVKTLKRRTKKSRGKYAVTFRKRRGRH